MHHRIAYFAAALAWIAAPIQAPAQTAFGFGGVGHDASQPVEVTAERLSIDQDSGEVIFAGDVLLAQGDLRLSAGEIYMRYVDGDAGAGVAEIRATGQVLLARGDDAAQGNQALYDVPNGMFTFQGDVMITQADAVIQGQALVIDLNTGIGEIQGRVRTVLGTGSAE